MNKVQVLYKQLDELPGYSIPNSHFRIGSKIHVADFFYAKRFFQNHVFASRFAFMLARDILRSLTDEKRVMIEREGLTMIGYGIYSELLMSLLEKFLKSCGKKSLSKINHNLVDDTSKFELVKNDIIYSHCIIIAPIASTFSTSIKVEEMIRKIKENNKETVTFFDHHYNLLYIAHGQETTDRFPIEKNFGWKSKNIDNKEIKMSAFFEELKASDRTQKYFVCLPSKWQSIEDCENCFPKKQKDKTEDPLAEKPLFDTDRTLVTTTSIFDFPKARKLEKEEEITGYELTPGMLLYGHHIRNHFHFFYRIDTEAFLFKNIKMITGWLKSLNGKRGIAFDESDHVLIIASCHHSNAAFINLVNDILFKSAANIIHFNPKQDYIQNFEIVYGSEICVADKIVFVDDSLKTGETLNKVDEFVQYALERKSEKYAHLHPGKASRIESCLFLINKAQHFTTYKFSDKALGNKAIYSFANLHLFTSLAYENSAPLEIERDRYKILAKESFLDSLKVHFFKQSVKLDTDRKVSGNPRQKERHLRMLEATHRIYQLFSTRGIPITQATTFPQFTRLLYKLTSIPFNNDYQYEDKESFFLPEDACLIKVLTQSPFTQFEPLRKLVFRWILSLLDNHLNSISESIAVGNLSFAQFSDLKFLLRRAGQMNSNYLISQKMLAAIQEIYAKGFVIIVGNLEMKDEKKLSEYGTLFDETAKNNLTEIRSMKITEINGFHLFYCTQIKELLLQNEARSIYLELQLQRLADGCSGFRQIIRILRTENVIVIQKFFDFIRQRKSWTTLYNHEDDVKPIDENVAPIEKLLEQETVKNHQRFQYLEKYFESTHQLPVVNKAFLEFLWLKYFIEHDKSLPHLRLSIKTDFIMAKLKLIIEHNDGRYKWGRVGAFLIIRDSRKISYLVYNKNDEYLSQLDASNWNKDKENYLEKFLEGNKATLNDNHSDDTIDINKPLSTVYKLSIVELALEAGKKKWIDLYNEKEDKEVDGLAIDLLPLNINRLVLMRLSTRDENNYESIQGLIGFYFQTDFVGMVCSNLTQYLMLLRTTLSEFVEKHHQNNEFSDWLVAENNRKLALLTGHGKYMLQKIAIDNKVYRKIILNLEHLQMIVLLNESVRNKNGDDEIVRAFNRFYNVGGKVTIDDTYRTHLDDMTRDIYKMAEIERFIPIKPDIIPLADDFSFSFNQDILDIICFELLLNAKKNRWHFLPDDLPGKLDGNELHVEIKEILQDTDPKRQMQIIISNTCPRMENRDISELNKRYSNLKKDDATAGTALIKKLVYDILDGTIDFKCEPIPDSEVHMFTVTITLKPMTPSNGS